MTKDTKITPNFIHSMDMDFWNKAIAPDVTVTMECYQIKPSILKELEKTKKSGDVL